MQADAHAHGRSARACAPGYHPVFKICSLYTTGCQLPCTSPHGSLLVLLYGIRRTYLVTGLQIHRGELVYAG